MLGDSSFSGQCSCSLLEMTGVVLPPAWQRRVLDYGCWEIHSLCFLPQPRFLSDLLHGPMLASAVCGGSAACSWLPGAQAGLGKRGAGAPQLCGWLTLPCPPRLAQLTSNALGMFIMSTALSGTIGLQETLQSLSSLCQQELLEALSTQKKRLILRWIKPH